ncbi:MAG: two-component sensor histidine kinase [Microbacterium sp.]|nr:MAG: two-component sensor histidine kinase [Microbacterium sp.]PZU38184.1 MAG: two-component sensor histidine kinase [Microbacterium sp.]
MKRQTPPAVAARSTSRASFRLELRDRVAAGNQLLLCGIVVVLFTGGLALGSLTRPGLFAIGALVIAIGAIVALSVPWSQVPPGWVALVPVVDIAAITVLRVAEPTSGVGLLWAFPAMWLASLGRWGLVTGCALIPTLYWVVVALTPSASFSFSTLLLPIVIVAISSAGYSSAQRFAAQRELLDAQAARLAFARAAAVRQEQLVSEVLDTVDFGVVRLSVGGDIVYENDAVGRFSSAIPGLHAASARTDLLLEDGVTPLDPSDHPLARVRRGDTIEDEVVWSRDAEGRLSALSFASRRLIDHRGEDSGAVIVARDVTAEREALRARDDLVASVSHELRTPLTSVLGYLELALDEDLPDRARRHVDTALSSGERLLAIVADILSASRSSRHSVESSVHPREIDVAEVVRASALALKPLAEERVIKVTVAADERVTAFADASRIRQVIDNLLGNAIKFNRDGGAVELAVRADGGTSVIEVRDTGVGIAEADRARVFERFFRASEDVAGNGLGLAISAEIVKAHGGRLSVDSTPGYGSTFTVELPSREPEESGA